MLKLKWIEEGNPWAASAKVGGYNLRAATYGDGHPGYWGAAGILGDSDGQPTTLRAMQEAAEAAIARVTAEDDGLRALLADESSENAAFQWKRKAQAAEARVAELEAAQRWIPVTERLPEEGVGVLAYGAAEYVTAWWDGRHFRDPHSLFEGITHWRPIPWPEVQPT